MGWRCGGGRVAASLYWFVEVREQWVKDAAAWYAEALSGAAAFPAPRTWEYEDAKIHVLDVGCAAAVLIVYRDGAYQHTTIIDVATRQHADMLIAACRAYARQHRGSARPYACGGDHLGDVHGPVLAPLDAIGLGRRSSARLSDSSARGSNEQRFLSGNESDPFDRSRAGEEATEESAGPNAEV